MQKILQTSFAASLLLTLGALGANAQMIMRGFADSDDQTACRLL